MGKSEAAKEAQTRVHLLADAIHPHDLHTKKKCERKVCALSPLLITAHTHTSIEITLILEIRFSFLAEKATKFRPHFCDQGGAIRTISPGDVFPAITLQCIEHCPKREYQRSAYLTTLPSQNCWSSKPHLLLASPHPPDLHSWTRSLTEVARPRVRWIGSAHDDVWSAKSERDLSRE